MNRFCLILVMSLILVSCKNKQEDFIFNFGLENKAIVDKNIKIPLYNKIKSISNDNVSYYSTTDYYTSPCYADSNKVKIISSSNPLYNFRITLNKDLTFQSTYNDIFSGNSSLFHRKILKSEITKQRLLINKNEYTIGDTIIGTYYFQLHFTFSRDSSSNINDSFSFAYIIKEKYYELDFIFNTESAFVIGYEHKTNIYFTNTNKIQINKNINQIFTDSLFKKSYKSKNMQIHSIKIFKNHSEIILKKDSDADPIFSLILKNSNYEFSYINPLPLLDGNTNDYYISHSNLYFNREKYYRGDTILCNGYYILSTMYSMVGTYHNKIDSFNFSTIIK